MVQFILSFIHAVIPVGIENVVPHFYLHLYPQNTWMQTCFPGLLGTLLEQENQECQSLLDFGILDCSKIWCARQESNLRPTA